MGMTASEALASAPARDSGVPILAIEDLSRSFGSHVVISGLDLTLAPGERLALRGPNGSGKSTLLRCAAGTVLPSRGVVRVAGHRAGSLPARHLVGASLSQERAFYLRLTGHENLLFYARLRHRGERAARGQVLELEDELDIGPIAAERMDRCSSGMIQQLSFARALLGSPALLLLDEPTRSLDAGARQRLWDAIDRRHDIALLMATHDDEDSARCGERIDLPL